MNITKLIEMLPTNVKTNIINFVNGTINGHDKVCRVVLDRKLSNDEIKEIEKIKGIYKVGTYSLKYAPEIKKSFIDIKGWI